MAWSQILAIAAYALAAFSVIPSLYLLSLGLAALGARRLRPRDVEPGAEGLGHLVIVIPAHNEEADIEATLDGLAQQLDRDSSLHVIADNCSDATAERVRGFAARAACTVRLWERNDPSKKSKGYALEWALPQIFAWSAERGTPTRFVCIVDADSALTPGSVVQARHGFAAGRSVLQSQYLFDRGLGLKAEIMRIASAAFVARGLGRSVLGLSDTLKGNGMWFRRDVLEQTPWCAYSLAEDLEYTLKIFPKGHSVHVLPGSQVVGKLSASATGETEQRLRWEGGRWAVIQSETGTLLRSLAIRPAWRTFDMLMELLIPPLGLLVSLQAAVLLLTAALPGQAWIVVLAGWAILGIFVVLGVLVAGLPARTLLALGYVPFYVVWKLVLLPRTLAASRSKRWVRTAR
jgi:cellulose synthase/poly-beta-1,6-N-acetylglucosamine synthase-like glycosyltransferase